MDMVIIIELFGFSFVCVGNFVMDDGFGSVFVMIFGSGILFFIVSWIGFSMGNVIDVGYELVSIVNLIVVSVYNIMIMDVNGCFDICEILVVDISMFDCDYFDYFVFFVFYNSINGVSWINNMGWIDGVVGMDCDFCFWFGIICDVNDWV